MTYQQAILTCETCHNVREGRAYAPGRSFSWCPQCQAMTLHAVVIKKAKNKRMESLFCAILMFCLGCRSLSEIDRLKRDLIGFTAGGREKSWRFESVDQIKSLTVDKRVGNTWFLSLVLHDHRATGTWLAKVKVDYAANRVQTVGLIYLEKIE